MSQLPTKPGTRRGAPWVVLLVGSLVLYVLSSGPMLAIGFKLRDLTGWNGFYGVIWLYYPLLACGHWQPLDLYVSWWCRLFNAVGPG